MLVVRSVAKRRSGEEAGWFNRVKVDDGKRLLAGPDRVGQGSAQPTPALISRAQGGITLGPEQGELLAMEKVDRRPSKRIV